MNDKHLKSDKKYKFLITGGAGFIGSNICNKLIEDGHTVICIDNLSNGKMENLYPILNNDKFSFIMEDIRNLEVCIKASQGVDFILHQAALGSVPRSIKMPLLYEDVNIKGTLNIFEAARINKIKRVVYASSSSVYGDEKTLPKTEKKVGNILSPYALTKKVNEEYAKLYSSLYDIETVGLRYFNVFGMNQNPEGEYAAVIPKFISQILKGEQPTINGNGEHSRDFTHIDNVVEANILSCFSPLTSKFSVFNIASGGRITLNELYSSISTILNSDISPIYGPERLGDIKHSFADISCAKNELNYKVITSFKTGLKKYIEWFQKNI